MASRARRSPAEAAQKRDLSLGALSAALFTLATVFGVLANTGTHWSDAAHDAAYPSAHVGLWRACELTKAGGACVDVDEALVGGGVLSHSQLERVKAARVMVAVATALLGLAAPAAAAFAAGYHRVPVAGLAALPLAHGVVATFLGVLSLLIYASVQVRAGCGTGSAAVGGAQSRRRAHARVGGGPSLTPASHPPASTPTPPAQDDGFAVTVGPVRHALTLRFGWSYDLAVMCTVLAAFASVPLMAVWTPAGRGKHAYVAGDGYVAVTPRRDSGLLVVP
jgi:hypothetical protein